MSNPTKSFVGTPAAEYEIDEQLVSTLLAEQHPDLAHLSIRALDAGWDNALFRLGDQLAVRLPRRAIAAPLVVHEQRWLPRLAGHFSLPVPVPIRIGVPSKIYPWHWSVVPWLAGSTADQTPPQPTEARSFAIFLRSLHVQAPSDAPINPFRGVALQQRAAAVQERMQRIASKTNMISPQIERVWQTAIQASIDVPPTWIHGDLHPRNVLVERGEITGIIDWGDITAGDRATDLASTWMLFTDADARDAVLETYDELSEATLQRALGWAVLFGVVFLDSGLIDNPRHAAIGERILRNVAESV
jgi:aminoglycoside phosphotransferase (APT) family kinase protein